MHVEVVTKQPTTIVIDTNSVSLLNPTSSEVL